MAAASLGKRPAVFAAGCHHLAAISLLSGIPIIGSIFVKGFRAAHLSFDPPWWLCAFVIAGLMIGLNVVGVQVSVRTQLLIILGGAGDPLRRRALASSPGSSTALRRWMMLCGAGTSAS